MDSKNLQKAFLEHMNKTLLTLILVIQINLNLP